MTHSTNLSAIERRLPSRGIHPGLLRELFSRRDLTTPLLLLSRSEVSRNYRALKEALPRAEIHYAVKPNNHSAVLAEVYRQAGNFDVCSAGEIDIVEKTGINPATLVHSHPVKSPDEFDYAVGRATPIAGSKSWCVSAFISTPAPWLISSTSSAVQWKKCCRWPD